MIMMNSLWCILFGALIGLHHAFSSSMDELKILVQSKYHEDYGIPGKEYQWLEGKFLFEPHKESHIMLLNGKSNKSYKWEIQESPNHEKVTYEGTEISHVFKVLGFNTITVKEYDGNLLEREVPFEAAVKYVRREIRKLFQEDRNELLDAMKLIWEVSDKDGRERWGGMYTSMYTLHKYHLIMAGDQACDHIHDGYGFLSHHSYLNFLFEQSLQAINPKLALPYWDYIYDIEEWNSVDESVRWDFTNSEIFTADFLGSTDPDTHFIKDGRWAELQLPYFYSQYYQPDEKVPHNAYGYLRSPWSNNPDPHLVRNQYVCGQLPTNEVDLASRCGALKELFEMNSWSEFGKYIAYLPHGRVHVLLGGALNCENAYDKLSSAFPPTDKVLPTKIRSLAYAIHKNLYRNRYLDCGDSAERNQVVFCSCINYDTLLEDETLMDQFLVDAMPGLGLEALSFTVKSSLVRTFCNSHLINGDALQSSSSYAPEFWLIHGNADRMFSYKSRYSDFEIGEWPESTYFMNYEFEEYCSGHNEDDRVLLGLRPTLIDGSVKVPSVREWLEMISPQNEETPYIYDDLRWDYCDQYGTKVHE